MEPDALNPVLWWSISTRQKSSDVPSRQVGWRSRRCGSARAKDATTGVAQILDVVVLPQLSLVEHRGDNAELGAKVAAVCHPAIAERRGQVALARGPAPRTHREEQSSPAFCCTRRRPPVAHER